MTASAIPLTTKNGKIESIFGKMESNHDRPGESKSIVHIWLIYVHTHDVPDPHLSTSQFGRILTKFITIGRNTDQTVAIHVMLLYDLARSVSLQSWYISNLSIDISSDSPTKIMSITLFLITQSLIHEIQAVIPDSEPVRGLGVDPPIHTDQGAGWSGAFSRDHPYRGNPIQIPVPAAHQNLGYQVHRISPQEILERQRAERESLQTLGIGDTDQMEEAYLERIRQDQPENQDASALSLIHI